MSNPKLTILSEVLRGQTFELSKDTYTIGRSEDKDITIVDPTVSGLHAILSRNDDGSYTVKDNGSTNGTRINGIIITEQKMNSSDILQVGGVEIMYEFGAHNMPANNTTRTIPIDGQKTEINTTGMQSIGLRSSKGGGGEKITTGLKVVIAVLAIVVLGLLGMVLWNIFFSS